jgi:pSer/pThr/pTyr-binding forkhead associated (FHA) protein
MPTHSTAYLLVVAVPQGQNAIAGFVTGVPPGVGQVFTLAPARNVVGRLVAPDIAIVLPWLVVSRKHSQLDFDGQSTWEIQDLMSRNGTFVNGQQVAPHTPWPICDGDHIHIAGLFGVELLFTFNPAAKLPDPPQSPTYEELLADDEFR